MIYKNIFIYSLVVCVLIATVGCKKLIEVDPPSTSINEANVFNTDATAIAAVTGMYTKISASSLTSTGVLSVSLNLGLSADEFVLFNRINNNVLNFYYSNSLTSGNIGVGFWGVFYPTIFVANSAIHGLTNSTRLNPVVRNQLMGESKFMRAFCYFYLVNLYGDIPLILTSNYKENTIAKKESQSNVYKQIITDLIDAKELLTLEYKGPTLLSSSSERIRPNKATAIALLSRVYLYIKEYTNAEAAATSVIEQTNLYDTVSLESVFLKNNREAIWQLQPVRNGWNTEEARTFILSSSGPNGSNKPVSLSLDLISRFDSSDARKAKWINSVTTSAGNRYFYAFKYKNAVLNSQVTEYSNVFRLAELFLIRAEARVYNNNIQGATNDLNLIRTRAGLPNLSINIPEVILDALIRERQIELFSEWGHRWLDLKRTKRLDAVMNEVCDRKGGTWNSNWQFYPIQTSELERNPFLIQNNGY